MLPKRTRNNQNRIAKFLIGAIVMMLVIVVSIKSYELYQKKAGYEQLKQELAQQIEYEQNRSEEISEYETYTQTKAYVEEVARDRLGLVYEGEILFRDENQN